MGSLANKRIVLGVTGGIAAYKAAEAVRRLRDVGASVRVVMTRAATEFITPLTMQAVSGQPVHQDLLDEKAEMAMGHIELARWADAVLVAPASADFLARLTQGRADDLLSAVCLAAKAPLAVAPAMNQQMWSNAATRANVETLRKRGVRVFGPAEGSQACGDVGPGRLLEPPALVDELSKLFTAGALEGCRVTVTAGPTWEALDPVRGLTNKSSGKMGYAVAQAAAEAGGRVILISGPTTLPDPERVDTVRVVSAQEMFDAVHKVVRRTDIFISAAAVVDYRPVDVAAQKIKKSADRLSLELERTPDILASVAALKTVPFTVGFAAETENLEAHARAKLASKKVNLVAANLVGCNGTGFDADNNELTVFGPAEPVAFEKQPKEKLARLLIQLIADHYHARLPQSQSRTQNSG
jgi:phosphopantothenoylcysteine decarboxylase/phosphopantothenate--cysteine ligase